MSHWPYKLGGYFLRLQGNKDQPAALARVSDLQEIHLPPLQSRFLAYMVEKRRAHRSDIIKDVWDGKELPSSPVKQVDQLARGLEKRLGAEHQYFDPDRGTGYIKIKGLIISED